jgi:hypothetical protein
VGIWVAPPELDHGEEVLWEAFANRKQGRRAVGGRLTVTNRRFLFQPNRLDGITGGRSWSCPLASVIGIEAIAPGAEVLTGGLRRRLGVMTDGGLEVFVVNAVDRQVVHLRDLLGLSA